MMIVVFGQLIVPPAGLEDRNQGGNSSHASKVLKKAASTSPKALQVHYHLTVGLFKSGDMTGACKVPGRVLASGSGTRESPPGKALLEDDVTGGYDKL